MSSLFRRCLPFLLAALTGAALAPAGASAGEFEVVGTPTIVERIDGSATKASALARMPEAPTRAFARAAAQPTSVTRVRPGSTPAGFYPLADAGIAPTAIGEEQLFNAATPQFRYDGQVFSQLGVTSNGYLVVGGGTDKDLICCSPVLGSTGRPNGVIAPFWTDLEPTTLRLGYVAPVGQPAGERPVWVVAEWEAKDFGTNTVRRFQVWIQSADPEVAGGQTPPAQGVYLTYDFTTMASEPVANPFVVGAENRDGTSGDQLPGLPTQNLVVSFETPNEAPVAVADSYTTGEGVKLDVSAPGPLGNDTDADGDTLVADVVTVPDHGSMTMLGNDGQFSYTPDPGFSGQDSFTYRAFDFRAFSAPVTVTITVTPRANTVPAVAADAYSAVEDTPLTVAAPGVLANDSDADGDAMTVAVTDAPAHGTLALAADGSFTYTPAAGYVGADRFAYRASDGRGQSLEAPVDLTVARTPNGVPTARADSFDVEQDERLTVAAPGVLDNDADPDGDPLTVVATDAPVNGTLVMAPDGSFTYTPHDDFTGSDRFGYRAGDGRDASPVTWVDLEIEAPDADAGNGDGGDAASVVDEVVPDTTPRPDVTVVASTDLAAPLASLFGMPRAVRMTTLSGKGFTPSVRCDEPCSVTVRMLVRKVGAKQPTTVLHTEPTPLARGLHTVPVQVAMERLRNMVRPRVATVVVSVTDATGNRQTQTRTLGLR